MNERYDFGQDTSGLSNGIVYVKSVNVADLPSKLRKAAGGKDRIYAVHKEDGEQLALVADRNLAFMLARQHDMTPVTVH